VAHPQIVRAHIEGKDFTLYYDYDQLRDGKLSRLTDDGKIEWFRLRMNFVFLEPLCRLYQGKTPAYRALNSTKQNDLPARSFVIPSFSVLLNGVEALGSFTTKRKSGNRDNFFAFMTTYMKPWDRNVPNSPYSTGDLKTILWEHFRNGIAHGFCIERGGIDNEADADRWLVVVDPTRSGSTTKRLEIGPNAFFRDFRAGVDRFFEAVKKDRVQRAAFFRRFREVYPT